MALAHKPDFAVKCKSVRTNNSGEPIINDLRALHPGRTPRIRYHEFWATSPKTRDGSQTVASRAIASRPRRRPTRSMISISRLPDFAGVNNVATRGIFSSVAVVAFFLAIGGVAANYFVTKKDTVPEIEIARIVEHVRSAVVQRSNRAKQTQRSTGRVSP